MCVIFFQGNVIPVIILVDLYSKRKQGTIVTLLAVVLKKYGFSLQHIFSSVVL